MNGETQVILQRLTAIEVKQEERHQENIVRMAKLEALPCDTHAERMKGIQKSNYYLWGAIGSIGTLIAAALINHFIN